MKTRLQNVMEAHGVSKDDIIRGLNARFGGNVCGFVNKLVKEEDLTDYGGRTIKAVAEICNCSADYLLGLSENMNPIG